MADLINTRIGEYGTDGNFKPFIHLIKNDVFTEITLNNIVLRENSTDAYIHVVGGSSSVNSRMIVSGKEIIRGNSSGVNMNNINEMNVYSINASDSVNIDSIALSNDSGYLKVNANIKATTFTATSDRRLKDIIGPLSYEKPITDLQVYEYTFKDNPNDPHIGIMAQDLQKLYPELVKEGSDGYLSIEEGKVVYLLLEEVKQLKREVEILKQRIGE